MPSDNESEAEEPRTEAPIAALQSSRVERILRFIHVEELKRGKPRIHKSAGEIWRRAGLEILQIVGYENRKVRNKFSSLCRKA